MDQLTQRTLDIRKRYMDGGVLAKAGISTGTGLVGYSLEPVAQLAYAVPVPLRNEIPRVKLTTPMSGTAAHWRQVTGINTSNISAVVEEGKRGGTISISAKTITAPFATFGSENFLTFEGESAAEGFEDVKADNSFMNLQSLWLQEESILLNGNFSNALGTTPTPTLAAAAGGALPASVNNQVYCVALTYDGYLNSTVSAAGVPGAASRANADGTTTAYGQGGAQVSAASASATTASSNLSVTATVAAVKGAFAYAWYLTQTPSAATAYLAAITTVNTATITAAPSSSNQAANSASISADRSTNALSMDGLFSQAFTGGGYFKSLDGATLTSTNVGEVVEIEVALKYFWDTYRLSPDRMIVGSQVMKDLGTKILTSTGTMLGYRINMEQNAQGKLQGGFRVATYLNKYMLGTGTSEVEIMNHPNCPPNTIFFDLRGIPPLYQQARINWGAARRVQCRREYYQIDWPLVTRNYQTGAYVEEVFEHALPFGSGAICNIGPG